MIPVKPSPDPTEAVTLDVVGVTVGAAATLGGDRPTIIMPIESAVASVVFNGDEGGEHTLDRSLFAVVPEGAVARVRPSAAVTSLAVLGLGEGVVERMVAAHHKLGVTADRLQQWLSAPSVLPRTVWVHEIVHRYVFERHALDEHESDAARFLEVEIAKELFFLFRDRDEGADRATIQQKHSPSVEKVMAFIDEHLFERRSVKELAAVAGVSESALLRAFRRQVGITPAAYWRRRKLDGALDLLRGGRHTVAEIAELVGYDNPTAFGDAFRRRFGRPPSTFKPTRTIKPAP
jgi:AraC-like DNA-binding protein